MRITVLLSALLLTTSHSASAQSVLAGIYAPITAEQRLAWVAKSSVGPVNLLTGLVGAGLDTWRNSPVEYGPGWEGFAKRNGLRLADRALASGIEAGVGSLWGEDPRYYPTPEKPFRGRAVNVFKMAVFTHDRLGNETPAYARFIAVPSAAFIALAWKPESQNDVSDALSRIGSSFANKIAGNAFAEFWPDVQRKMFHRGSKTTPDFVDRFAAEAGR